MLTRNQDSLLAAIRRFDGRKYDYQPRNQFEEQYAMYPAAVVERIRNQVTLSALEVARRAHGLAARGAQGGHPGERGVQQHPARRS